MGKGAVASSVRRRVENIGHCQVNRARGTERICNKVARIPVSEDSSCSKVERARADVVRIIVQEELVSVEGRGVGHVDFNLEGTSCYEGAAA